MPYYKDWDSMVEAAQKKCKTILEKNVAPVAEGIVKDRIQEDIYNAYQPQPGKWVYGTTYQRRHMLGERVYHILKKDNEIVITSSETASPPIIKGYRFEYRHPGAFLELLESGHMGIWRSGFPRPAISNAQKEIDDDQDSKIALAIEAGLNEQFG